MQQSIPSLKDLLPVFPYIKKDGATIDVQSMYEKNLWLSNLDNILPTNPLLGTLFSIAGSKENSTLSMLDVQERSKLDQLLGRWVDGKPVGENKDAGDDTVLVTSATLNNMSNSILLPNLDHGEIIESQLGQKAITDHLGITPLPFAATAQNTYEPSLVFQLASPANMVIYGPLGWIVGEGYYSNIPNSTYSSEDKLALIPNPREGNYIIEVKAVGSGGPYRLFVGYINKGGDFWKEYTGVATPGVSDKYVFNAINPLELKSYILDQVRIMISDLRKDLDLQGFPTDLRGIVESDLANSQGYINATQGTNNHGIVNNKIELTLLNILELEANFEQNDELDESFKARLQDIKDYLIQAYDMD